MTLDDGANTQAGGAAADEILALAGNDSIDGGGGNDTLNGGTGTDTLHGGIGNDQIIAAAGAGFGTDREQLFGDDGDDTISADGSYADMHGGDGNDVITGAKVGVVEGGAGADMLTAPTGLLSATLSYVGSLKAVSVDLATGAVAGGDATGDTIVNFANLEGSALADTLSGGNANNAIAGLGGHDGVLGRDGDDSLSGGDGNDTLDGGAGDDVLSGGSGADDLRGGDGIDTASYELLAVAVTVNLSTGAVGQGAAGDLFSSIENAIGSDGGNDNLTGTGFANALSGLDGDDLLAGGAGNDTLSGGDGADTLRGGDGNDELAGGRNGDVIDGGAGIDTATFTNPFGLGVDIDLERGTGLVGDSLEDRYSGIENVVTSFYADTVAGDGGNNRFDADSGNDVLSGRGGYDTIDGGAGADTIDGGDGIDTIIFKSSFGALKINLATGLGSGGKAEGDHYAGIERVISDTGNDLLTGSNAANLFDGGVGRDTIQGSGGNDSLIGGSEADVLGGGKGNDRLVGGLGADTMRGDAGVDTFDFDTVKESGVTIPLADSIIGFVAGSDRIDLSTIDAKASTAATNDAFTFIDSAPFTAEGQVQVIAAAAGVTYVAINVSGTGGTDMLIRFTGDVAFTAADFVL